MSDTQERPVSQLVDIAELLKECERQEARIDRTAQDVPRAFVDTITIRAILRLGEQS